MGKLLKWIGISIGALVVLLLVAVGVVYSVSTSRMEQKFNVTVKAPPIPSNAAALKEGQRLFISRGCVDCHGNNLAGKVFVDDPLAGTVSGANLTKGKGGIGGTFTDADFVRAIRHGVAPDGRALIFMPSTDYYSMSDADIGAIIAYVRSVPAVDRPSLAPRIGPMARLLYLQGQMPFLVSAQVIDHSTKPSTAAPAATIEYGRYLGAMCTGCHGFGYSGGSIPGAPPQWAPAANITPHPVAGIGKWSETDFAKALREAIRPDGKKLREPMATMSENARQMTDTEVKALWMFLRTVPAKETGGR